MSQPVICVESLSKSYLIGHQGSRVRCSSLRETLSKQARIFARRTINTFAGKQMPQGASVEEFWALKDVSFGVQQGEVLGIIGRNGAGKSTLLKVLSRITEPTSGKVTTRGRVASLLEVGTGFHPELSGRENIYLNGAILGMSRREIKAKFDEIVDFAGVEKFLDTPVKRYSSGMYVRLAFAVAAHLEPDILVVDEVLAVGDAEFQKKCMGKLKNVAGQGRTVLFVSHSMPAITNLCSKCAYLKDGTLADIGKTQDVVNSYNKRTSNYEVRKFSWEGKDHRFDLLNLWVGEMTREMKSNFGTFEEIFIFAECVAQRKSNLELSLTVMNARGTKIFTADRRKPWTSEKITTSCRIPPGILVPGNYSIAVGIHVPGFETLSYSEDAVAFTVEETGSGMEIHGSADYGCVLSPCNWEDQSD